MFDSSVSRVQVVDELGKTVWRKPSEIRDTDTIKINPQTGAPVVMSGLPGRPGSNEITLTNPYSGPPAHYQTGGPTGTNSALNDLHKRRKEAMVEDKVLDQTLKNSDSGVVLDAVLEGLAEEAASLKFERAEAERKGENTSQLSIRRISALKAVGDTWLKKKEVLSGQSVDLESKAFKIIFGFIAETFRKACDEAKVRPEMSESVFANFGKMVDGDEWLKEAKARMEKGE